MGGRSKPPVSRRRLCGQCGVALGPGACTCCGAAVEGAVEGQNHQGGAAWARVEIELRCPCEEGSWSRLPAAQGRVRCRCGRDAGLDPEQLRIVARAAHGAADLGSGGEGLHGLRWLPLQKRNPYAELGVSGENKLVEQQSSEGFLLRLRLRPGHPRCPLCKGTVGFSRRPAVRAAGGLQCAGCKVEIEPSPWVGLLASAVPIRAAMEEREEADDPAGNGAPYRTLGATGALASLWLCLEGPSRERMELERALLQKSNPIPRQSSASWGFFAGSFLGGLGLMTAITPPRGIEARQVVELRGVGLFLGLFFLGVALLGPKPWAPGRG